MTKGKFMSGMRSMRAGLGDKVWVGHRRIFSRKSRTVIRNLVINNRKLPMMHEALRPKANEGQVSAKYKLTSLTRKPLDRLPRLLNASISFQDDHGGESILPLWYQHFSSKVRPETDSILKRALSLQYMPPCYWRNGFLSCPNRSKASRSDSRFARLVFPYIHKTLYFQL